jgi:hypothetical protein
VWHRRSQQDNAHLWLRETLVRAADKAFSA